MDEKRSNLHKIIKELRQQDDLFPNNVISIFFSGQESKKDKEDLRYLRDVGAIELKEERPSRFYPQGRALINILKDESDVLGIIKASLNCNTEVVLENSPSTDDLYWKDIEKGLFSFNGSVYAPISRSSGIRKAVFTVAMNFFIKKRVFTLMELKEALDPQFKLKTREIRKEIEAVNKVIGPRYGYEISLIDPGKFSVIKHRFQNKKRMKRNIVSDIVKSFLEHPSYFPLVPTL